MVKSIILIQLAVISYFVFFLSLLFVCLDFLTILARFLSWFIVGFKSNKLYNIYIVLHLNLDIYHFITLIPFFIFYYKSFTRTYSNTSIHVFFTHNVSKLLLLFVFVLSENNQKDIFSISFSFFYFIYNFFFGIIKLLYYSLERFQ